MCDFVLLKWYCDECGAWYTSDAVKVDDCDAVKEGAEESGSCSGVNYISEETSDASGFCAECTAEHSQSP